MSHRNLVAFVNDRIQTHEMYKLLSAIATLEMLVFWRLLRKHHDGIIPRRYLCMPRYKPPKYGISQISQTKRLYLWNPFLVSSLPFRATRVAHTACTSMSQSAICPVSVCGCRRSKGPSAMRCMANVPHASKKKPIQNAVTCHVFR
jgi:hypothetical protein